MRKIKRYRYIGRNGILTSYVELDNVPCSIIYILEAEEGKLLTDGVKTERVVHVYEENVSNWYEIDDPEANLNKKQ